jgi:hypothetical protein
MTTTLSTEGQPRNARMTRKEDEKKMAFSFVCFVSFVVSSSDSYDSTDSWLKKT